MMKTWIGLSWTGSGSGFIDEFATSKQVSISSAMVRLCGRNEGEIGLLRCCTRGGAGIAPVMGAWVVVVGWVESGWVVVDGAWGRARVEGREAAKGLAEDAQGPGPPSCMLYPHRSRSRRGALGCKLHLCLALPCGSLSLSEPVRSGWIVRRVEGDSAEWIVRWIP